MDSPPAAPSGARPPGRGLLTFALVTLFAALIQLGTLGAGFIYDDEPVVLEDAGIRHWNRFLAVDTSPIVWSRPVRRLSLALDYRLWGLDPLGYHLTNVVLHALGCGLLFALVGTLLRDARLGLLTALLFAVHPVHSEAVAVVSNRKEILALLFLLVAFLAHGEIGRRRWAFPVAALAYLLAMLSKEVAIVLPLVLVLADAFFPRKAGAGAGARGGGSGLATRLPYHLAYGAVGAAFFVLGYGSYFGARLSEPSVTGGLAGTLLRLYDVSRAVLVDLRLFLLPVNLSADHPFVRSASPSDAAGIASVALLAAFLAVPIALRRRRKTIAFGLAWFAIHLVPVSNAVELNFPVAERYLYIPSAGLCIVLARLILDLARTSRRAAVVVGTAVLVLYATLTIARNEEWRSPERLWARTLEGNPSSVAARNNLGLALIESGRIDEAIAQYAKLVQGGAATAEVWNNLGNAYGAKGGSMDAMVSYEEALALDPTFHKALNNLGNLHQDLGDAEGAIARYKRALEIRPDYALAHLNLGTVLATRGSWDLAAEHYGTAARLDPAFAEAHNALGKTLVKLGRLAEAEESYRAAIRARPDYAEAHHNLGNALCLLGRTGEGLVEYEEAVRADPSHAEAQFNLAVLRREQGRRREAIEGFRKVLEIRKEDEDDDLAARARAALAAIEDG